MERKDFLKSSFSALGWIAVAPLVHSCKKEDMNADSNYNRQFIRKRQ